MKTDRFSEGPLTLEVGQEDEVVRVRFLGKSTAREPGPFIVGVLQGALERGQASGVPLVLDFQTVEYMNSSTITPVIRMLDHARRNAASVKVIYKRDLKWQALSFTALNMFETPDGRIEIRGI